MLKQNASAVVARAAAGETVVITDRGRRVAHLTPIPSSPLQQLIDSGRARPALGDLRRLPSPAPGDGLSEGLAAMRDEERY